MNLRVGDRSWCPLAWNSGAENLWGLRTDEAVGQHLLGLGIGLPVDRLQPALRACLHGESPRQQVVLAAFNRRGLPIKREVGVTPLHLVGDSRSAILLMQETTSPRS